jgi:hypothetical protein
MKVHAQTTLSMDVADATARLNASSCTWEKSAVAFRSSSLEGAHSTKGANANVNAYSLGLSNATEEQQVKRKSDNYINIEMNLKCW